LHTNIDVSLFVLKKRCGSQTPDGITLKKLQLDEEKKRVLLRPLNQEYDVIVLEEYELETFRILGEMALLFRVV
jgi:SOS-response transcriptional repressor LexA